MQLVREFAIIDLNFFSVQISKSFIFYFHIIFITHHYQRGDE